jgi:hypothetical protein
MLRVTGAEWQKTKAVLLSKGLIDSDNKPTAWEKRQYASDSSAERVSRHRAEKKKQCNVDVTLQSRPVEAEIEAEIDKDKVKSIGADKPRKPASKATSLPSDFYPNATGVEYADSRRVPLAVELESFRNWHMAKGSTMKDWQAAWRTWCDKAVEFGRAGVTANGARASPGNSRDEGRRQVLEVLTGAGRNEQRIERDITGEALRLAG